MKGDIGDPGSIGPKGDPGEIGDQGPKGDLGAEGMMGNNGTEGPTGEMGLKGPDVRHKCLFVISSLGIIVILSITGHCRRTSEKLTTKLHPPLSTNVPENLMFKASWLTAAKLDFFTLSQILNLPLSKHNVQTPL